TCRALVTAYLARIDAFDKKGPAINAIVVTNPNALNEADELDRRFRQGGLTGPLHCVPAIVKHIKDAGALVLAKSNMAEFAFSPYETVNSLLPGYTRNPYALDRVTAGSS